MGATAQWRGVGAIVGGRDSSGGGQQWGCLQPKNRPSNH